MTAQSTAHPTVAGVRGRALLAALGLALAAAVLPATAAHASPQSPDMGNQLTNPGGNPQPPEPPTRRCPRTRPRTRTPSPPAATPSRPRSAWTPASAAPLPVRTRRRAWP